MALDDCDWGDEGRPYLDGFNILGYEYFSRWGEPRGRPAGIGHILGDRELGDREGRPCIGFNRMQQN